MFKAALRGRLLSFIYRVSYTFGKPIYERYLISEVRNNNLPNHIGIILDGNRRYAESRKREPWWGHEQGAKKLEEVLRWCLDLGIKYVTVYAFSSENLRRSKREVLKLFELFKRKLLEAADAEIIHKYRVRIRVLGRIGLLPPDLQEAIHYAQERTKNYRDHTLAVCLLYGGRQEIVDAVRQIAREVLEGKIKVEEIDEKTVESYLYTDGLPDPDLIIRTSGEERLSNFLLWQSAYSELYFSDVLFPEFRKIDLLRAIRSYQNRKRRFGR